MAKLNGNKNEKKCLFYKEKGFVGLTPELDIGFFASPMISMRLRAKTYLPTFFLSKTRIFF
jgi:hypothetical protein